MVQDIDECAYDETIDPITLLKVKTATGTNKCPSVELCQNKIGSYECICSSSDGYQPNPADCEPLLKPDALVKIMTNVQTTCTIVLKVCGHNFLKFFNYNSVCTNLDILDEIANPNGDPFKCSCNTNYAGNSKLCDLIGWFHFSLQSNQTWVI